MSFQEPVGACGFFGAAPCSRESGASGAVVAGACKFARPARVLLVWVAEGGFAREAGAARPPSVLETAGAALLRRWEKAALPIVFAESAASARDAAAEPADRALRPAAGDCLYRAGAPSLLRDPAFVRLFERLGGPLLILVGDVLGELALQTATDGFLAGHPIIVVSDAAPAPLADVAAARCARASALPLLSCLARVMTARELAREWIGD